ncbi:Glycoside hydrolase [Macleaya cordata]|uniref:Glycoside hydrolase n=1 Tax=Macleaya cordata TaxID=56857 RepID=A0A200QJJ8_MACCD|nr:Glycoside hydrolase [Macleaya cordata]
MGELKMIKFMLTIVTLTTLCSSSANAVYNVMKLGAKPDGRTDSTKAFLDAWAGACGSVRSAMIYVPPGRYLLNHAVFNGGQCKNTDITIRIDGTLVAPSNYWVLGNSNADSWLAFQWVTGVSIQGGILDGQGSSLWACKASGQKCPPGVTSLSFTNSKDVVIHGLTSINSQMFHMVINGCDNVNMKGVKINAPVDSPNTDGIHVQLSTGVTIMSSGIRTGDDCISVGPGTDNLWIEHVACGPGHGISIGSLGKDLDEPGVKNVTVKTVVFTGTQNGLRIKAWGRPSNGFVNGVLFQHVLMKNVENPIVIDQNYCPRNEGCPTQVSGIKISKITYQDIQGSSATPVAVKFDCSNKNPCQGIRLENVKLTYQNRPAQSSCVNADGSAHGLVVPASCL